MASPGASSSGPQLPEPAVAAAAVGPSGAVADAAALPAGGRMRRSDGASAPRGVAPRPRTKRLAVRPPAGTWRELAETDLHAVRATSRSWRAFFGAPKLTTTIASFGCPLYEQAAREAKSRNVVEYEWLTNPDNWDNGH